MPIYEYQCQSCGHELEILQKISDDPATQCPKCGQAALVKKISAAGFQLKGGGWYETDYKNPPKATTNETKPADTEKKTETKAEASKTTEKKSSGDANE